MNQIKVLPTNSFKNVSIPAIAITSLLHYEYVELHLSKVDVVGDRLVMDSTTDKDRVHTEYF